MDKNIEEKQSHSEQTTTIDLSKQPNHIILIRHAHTYYNEELHNLEKKYPELKSIRQHPQGLAFISDPKYTNSELTEKGLEQTKKQSEPISQLKFHSVFVSPAKRTIQTCIFLFENHPEIDKIIFYVHPGISEVFNSSSILTLEDTVEMIQNMQTKIQFDFTYLSYQTPVNLWMLDVCFDDADKRKQSLKGAGKVSNQDIFQYMLEGLEKAEKGNLETYTHVYYRTHKFQDFLKDYMIQNKLETDERKITLVSHSATLLCMTSTELDERGYVRGGQKMKNCEIFYYQLF